MKTKHRLLLVLASLLTPLASAAESSGPRDQIIVTASRAPVDINQVGAAVTVIGRSEIERREARTIGELLRSVPGFAVSHTGGFGSQTQVRVRGAEANHILVLIDGVRATDPAMGDEFRWEYLSTASIERIEVVRGAQSALWGSDAVAGVVNIITRPALAGPHLRGYAEAGSFSTSNVGIDGNFRNERWTFGGGIEYLATDGDNVSRTGTEKDDSDLTTVNLNLRFDAGEAVDLYAGIRAVDAYTQFDPVDFFVTGLPTDGDVATEATNLYGNVGVEIDGETVRHALRLDYFDSDNDNLADGDVGSSTSSDRTTVGYQADIALAGNRLILAATHEQTRFRQRGTFVFGDPNQDQEMDSTSAIVEFQGLSGERFSWIASARFDSNSDFDDAVNGRLSATYAAGEATILRASVGTGRKNPTFTERFGFFPGQFIGNPDLEPERSTSYELGLDHTFANGAAVLQLTLFKQDLQDEINGFVFDPATFLSTAENMDGTSRRDGVEVAINWTVQSGIDLGMHYTYTDSRDALAAEIRRPKHAGGLSVSVASFEERLQSTLTADYSGSREDTFFPPFPNPAVIVTLDSYWLVDLAVQYRLSDGVRLFAKGANLLDEDYEHVYGYRTPGRTGYLRRPRRLRPIGGRHEKSVGCPGVVAASRAAPVRRFAGWGHGTVLGRVCVAARRLAGAAVAAHTCRARVRFL